ncbi:MAG: hypothetical protein ACK4KW_03010 [Gemmobacter sp.]
MMEFMRSRMARWRDERELAALGSDIARDIAVSQVQLDTFAEMPADVPERMARMAALHGLSPSALTADRGEYLEFAETCGRCGARRICAETLDAGNARPEDCGFCPNHAAYEAKARR